MYRKSLALIPLLLSAAAAAAQEGPPRPDEEAVDSTTFSVPFDADESSGEATYQTKGKKQVTQSYARAYRSPTLRGLFLAQWMYIVQQGRVVEFWGARIIRLEPDSPLRTLGVRRGDVITRLDGLPIWRGMYREQGGPWQIVELENHFGLTETRFILQGAARVRVGQMNLDTYPDDPAPLPP